MPYISMLINQVTQKRKKEKTKQKERKKKEKNIDSVTFIQFQRIRGQAVCHRPKNGDFYASRYSYDRCRVTAVQKCSLVQLCVLSEPCLKNLNKNNQEFLLVVITKNKQTWTCSPPPHPQLLRCDGGFGTANHLRSFSQEEHPQQQKSVARKARRVAAVLASTAKADLVG